MNFEIRAAVEFLRNHLFEESARCGPAEALKTEMWWAEQALTKRGGPRPEGSCLEPITNFRRYDISGSVGRQQQALGDQRLCGRFDFGDIDLALAVSFFE